MYGGEMETRMPPALFDADLSGPTAWLFGNEAWGLPEDLAALADHHVATPIPSRAEGLNLSTAIEAARQYKERRPSLVENVG